MPYILFIQAQPSLIKIEEVYTMSYINPYLYCSAIMLSAMVLVCIITEHIENQENITLLDYQENDF